jgi:hypothetical protein
MNSNNKAIEDIENEMETYNNDITRLQDERSNVGNSKMTELNELTKRIGEKSTNLYNAKIYKESLMNSLQNILIILETKENEKNDILKQIEVFIEKENSLLSKRSVVEDMIGILIEYESTEVKEDVQKLDKHLGKLNDIFDIIDRLDVS